MKIISFIKTIKISLRSQARFDEIIKNFCSTKTLKFVCEKTCFLRFSTPWTAHANLDNANDITYDKICTLWFVTSLNKMSPLYVTVKVTFLPHRPSLSLFTMWYTKLFCVWSSCWKYVITSNDWPQVSLLWWNVPDIVIAGNYMFLGGNDKCLSAGIKKFPTVIWLHSRR